MLKNAGWFTIKDTEISRKNNADGTVCATHRLCLENKELAVRTESQVRVEWSPGAVLENKTYTMEHTTLLASDHSAVILEGYEYLGKKTGGQTVAAILRVGKKTDVRWIKGKKHE